MSWMPSVRPVLSHMARMQSLWCARQKTLRQSSRQASARGLAYLLSWGNKPWERLAQRLKDEKVESVYVDRLEGKLGRKVTVEDQINELEQEILQETAGALRRSEDKVRFCEGQCTLITRMQRCCQQLFLPTFPFVRATRPCRGEILGHDACLMRCAGQLHSATVAVQGPGYQQGKKRRDQAAAHRRLQQTAARRDCRKTRFDHPPRGMWNAHQELGSHPSPVPSATPLSR